jgi:hypothetical protein
MLTVLLFHGTAASLQPPTEHFSLFFSFHSLSSYCSSGLCQPLSPQTNVTHFYFLLWMLSILGADFLFQLAFAE